MAYYPAKADRRQVNINVSAKVHSRCVEEAAKRNTSVSGYVSMLFDAAYAASVKETGDRTLDATVAASLILYGAGMDTEAIARALKISEATVERIIIALPKVAA